MQNNKQDAKDQSQLGEGFWEKGVSGSSENKGLEVESWVQLAGCGLLRTAFLTALPVLSRSPDSSLHETAFSCYSKNSLDSSSLADQKPSLLFTYQFSHYPRFPFDYPMNQHFMTLAPWFLEKDSKHFFLNVANEFRDLPAFVNINNKLSWVGSCPEITTP